MNNYVSIFDVIGPNIVGPSSSHTAGAASIALTARRLFRNEIVKADFVLYGSFAKTYRGHGTDKALVGGVLGFAADDLRIRDAFEHAKQRGLEYSFTEDHTTDVSHPNTADVTLYGRSEKKLFIRGESTGGGRIKITKLNNVDVDFTGEYGTLIVSQKDSPGVVAHITACLAERKLNVASMRLYREAKGEKAYTIIESDQPIPASIVERINQHESIHSSLVLQV